MFFINIDNGNEGFVIVVNDGRSAWHVYWAFQKSMKTDRIATWMTIMNSIGEFYYPRGGNIEIITNPINKEIPLNDYAKLDKITSDVGLKKTNLENLN